MSDKNLSPEQAARFQNDVQGELERREWTEAGVMAEYICVLLANGNPKDRVHSEMDDLVGGDFDPSFLDWLFARRDAIRSPPPPPASPPRAKGVELMPESDSSAQPSSGAGSRMFASAVEGTKRKAESSIDDQNKRRLPDRPLGAPPSGPRAMDNQRPQQGRNLADRLGPRGMQPRGGLNVRGAAHGGPGPRAMGGPGFRPPMGGGGFPGGGFMPGQQEMMMQMMAMQANMAQMAQQMQQMTDDKSKPVRPTRGAPVKVPAGTKLGGHAVSAIQPRTGALGPIPDKPSSTALCKFGVGCSNARCTYSHPSPVADEKTGMVLSEEACEAGKNCKDAECVKSHVSPAAVHGATAGPSRMLCKYQNCTNPSCQYRHEDENGNPIAPPALNKPAAAAGEAGESKLSLDSALEDGTTERPCRYAERCTRPDCKFSHPASRPTPRAGKPARGGARGGGPARASAVGSGEVISGGMSASKKFGATAPLNPAAGEFKPAGASAAEGELEVSM